MFSKLALIISVVYMAVVVAAAPSAGDPAVDLIITDILLPEDTTTTPAWTGQAPGPDSCTTGPVQCCNGVYDADSQEGTFLLGLFAGAIGPFTGMLAASCSPITFEGFSGGSSCTANAVCCSNNEFRGAVAVGCTPVNVNI